MGDGVVIIGAGECGARAAFALREAGFDGTITLIGDEPHLPYERPPLSKQHPVAPKPVAAGEAYVEAGIELVRGQTVASIDRAKTLIALPSGETLPYKTLLLTTGARARILPGLEAAKTLRTLDDAHAILTTISGSTRLVIIGGGFIGLELAATARNLGANVTVIETGDRLLARAVPAEIAAVVERRHREAGVELVIGGQVTAARANRIELADGRAIDADLVVAGVGAQPNSELAAAAGIVVDNGIRVDGRFRTSHPDIFAAGDCCNFPWRGAGVRLESWRAAQDQGRHAARSMLGVDEPYGRVPWFWSDQYELTLQVAGLPDRNAPFVRRDLDNGAFVLFQIAADGKLISASGIGSGNGVAKDIRLAEMIIERELRPPAALLEDPSVNLKTLLRG